MRIYDIYQAVLQDMQRTCRHYVNEHYDMVWDDGVSWEYGVGEIVITYFDPKRLETRTIVVELGDLLEWADENIK